MNAVDTKSCSKYNADMGEDRPEQIGLNPVKLAEAREVLINGFEAGEYTTAVYAIGLQGRVAASGALGHFGDGEPTCEDSIFDIASLTKPIATASSLMILLEQGRIGLDQSVTDFFCMPHLEGVTIEHLATHTSGLPAWQDMYSQGQSRDDLIEQLLHIPLENSPGEKYVYSCLGYIMLGLIIERVAGMSLSEFAAETIFRPLGMTDTGFNPPSEKTSRIVRTANCLGREQVLTGEVQDGNASAMDGISGNAGLFSTVGDLAVFAQTMLNGGEFEGTRILSRGSVEKMLTNRIDPLIGGQAIGFFTRPNEKLAFGNFFSDRVVGHTGFTGTSLLIDSAWDMFVILLTNRVFIKKDASDFLNRRRLFYAVKL